MPKNKNNKFGKMVGPSKGKNMMPKKKKKNKKTKKSMVQTQANKLRQNKLLELALKQTIDEEEQEAAEDEIDDQLLRNTAVNSFSHKTGKPPTENEINEKMDELRRREKDARAQLRFTRALQSIMEKYGDTEL